MYSKNKYFYLFISLVLFSCTQHDNIKNIGEAEYYFDEKLSSISPDDNGGFWIGSETGDIINFKDNQSITFELGEDRIYKVKKEIEQSGDTIFWIGIRNSGLQKWKKHNNKLEKKKTYKINFKQDKYSSYDFIQSGKSIYIATSQGIYSLDKEKDSNYLSLIYPTEKFLSKQNGYSFVTHNICQYQDSLLLVSTQNGIFIYNTLNNKSRFILKDHAIEHVSIYNDTIFSISTKFLYLNNIQGDLLEKIEIGNNAKLYYRTQGIHYLVGAEEILLSKDLKEFIHINLRRTVPMICRNIILPDTLNNFTYLLTENAIWKIPNNIDVFKGNKPIKASCSNTDNIYYLTLQNALYVQNKNNNKAKWIYTFPSDNPIQWMDISGNELYFYNTDNKLQKMNLSDSWLKNLLFCSPEEIIQPKEKIITAKIKERKENPLIYLGVQDGMLIIDKNRIDTVKQLNNAYITSMFEHTYSNLLYISTLNDGVMYFNQDNDLKQIPNTEKVNFIEDIITTNDHNSNLIMLTNQRLISQETKDSIRIKGYKKLLYANDTLFYALPEFGLQKFIISQNKLIDKGIFFKDIRFNRNSSFSIQDKLVLGSNLGSLTVPINDEKSPIWVEFDNAKDINFMLFSLLALIVIIIAFIIYIILAKKHNANIIQIEKRKEDLRKRIDDLSAFYSILDENKNVEISDLKNLIDAIQINSKYKKDINIKLEKYSLRIGKLNRKVALLIPQKLEDQIDQITQTESFEKTSLLKKSYEVQKQNDIELIKEQVRTNELWLQERAKLFGALRHNIEKFSGCVEIEGVNKHLYNKLVYISNDDKHTPLIKLIDSYEQLEKEITEVNSPLSTETINSYIESIKNYLDKKIRHDQGLYFLQEQLDKILSQYPEDNVILLKGLKNIEPHLLVLKNLDEIRKLTIEYKEKYNFLIKENNEQVNKKFDKELASFIIDKTQAITHSINEHINMLYNHLSDKDKYIVADILKLTNIEGQHAKVLALLLADMKIKRSLISGMLGIFGNLNPVISRLINDRIRVNESILRTELNSNNNTSVFVYLVLKMLN